MSKAEFFPVGRIIAPHGVKGEVKVLLYGGVEDFPWKTVIIEGGAKGKGAAGGEKGPGVEAARDGAEGREGVKGREPGTTGPVFLNVTSVRRHQQHFLVFFEGYDTREASAALSGSEVSVKEEDLPPLAPDEFYTRDLIGISVVTDEGVELGTVANIIETGATDVIEVHGPLGEVLIPMAADFILSVDMDKKEMAVHLLEGMLPKEK